MSRRIRLYEWAAGKLLVRSARLRLSRSNGLEDAHEIRHIQAALFAGNSDECQQGRRCLLDDPTVAGGLTHLARAVPR